MPAELSQLPGIELLRHGHGAAPIGPGALASIAHHVTALVINFNTARQTVRCVQSLLEGTVVPSRILVLDNASAAADLELLQRDLPWHCASAVSLYHSADNLGFAQGSNVLLHQALRHADCRHLLLLNNDAVAQPGLLQALLEAVQPRPGRQTAHMAGARMHRLAQPAQVDTLGIALYASLMPADRKTVDDPYMGPTGGCALYSRELLDALHQASGYWFDPRYFCYCEDTDLVLRARLLGFEAAFVDDMLALHEGQASSQAAGPSDFVAYHGLRNSIWMQAKLIPTPLLLRYGLWLLVAHGATVLRYLLSGRGTVLWRVYRDAWTQRRAFLRERAQWRQQAPHGAALLRPHIAPHFYRKGYFRQVLLERFKRNR